MASDVESVSAVLDGAGEAAHVTRVLLDHRHPDVVLHELPGGRQPSGAGAHDHHVVALGFHGQRAHSVSTGQRRSAVVLANWLRAS